MKNLISYKVKNRIKIFFKNKIRDNCSTKIKWMSSHHYADFYNAEWTLAYQRSSTHYKPVLSIGKIKVNFGQMIVSELPELGVLKISEGHVLCPQGWVLSKEGNLLPEHSWYGRHISEMKMPSRLPNEIYISGNVLSLLSDWADKNYGHFLLDSLTRYHLFKKAGLSINDVDCVLCPGSDNQGRKNLIQKLGIPLDKCMWVCEDTLITAETLFVTSFPGIRRNYQSWQAHYLKNAFGVVNESSNRKLYVTRNNCTRKVANEEDVISLVQSYGYEIYNPTEHNDTISDFGSANMVIGPHGAGLADIVFCSPGARVLELIPSDHIYPYYYTLAESAGLKYACIVSRSLTNRRKPTKGPSQYDFSVNIDELKQAIDSFLQ